MSQSAKPPFGHVIGSVSPALFPDDLPGNSEQQDVASDWTIASFPASVSPFQMRTALAFACTILLMHARAETRLVAEKGRWQMLRDGQPFFIKGGGGNEQAMKSLAAAGGNSIRLWGDEHLGEAAGCGAKSGAAGVWESGKDVNGAFSEPTSTAKAAAKAAAYRAAYEGGVLAQPGVCLGSYAFVWGQKEEVKEIKMDPPCTVKPQAGASCLKCEFASDKGWGGVVWQNPANDWGDKGGGYDLTGGPSRPMA